MMEIQVRPEELIAFAEKLRQAAEQMRRMAWRYRKAVAGLDWEVSVKEAVAGHVTHASRQSEKLARRAEEMASRLLDIAEGFRRVDRDEAQMIGTGQAEVSIRDAAVGAVTGAVTGGAAGSVPAEPEATPTPTAPPASTEPDAFWSGVGAAPVANGQFAPQFQPWVDKFNARIDEYWRESPNDYSGHHDVDTLLNTYRLTPEKVEKLWAFSTENHVDPRLLLAILGQEGTGSFDTNAANAEAYGGNGPQPDWDTDLKAALDGPILAKLRLYPAAVKARFPGTWVQWINWYTPIDTHSFQGAAGVYAADINWGAGVERNYRQVAEALDTGGGDPVQAYSQWMGENSSLFTPRYVEGDFVIKQGLAEGDRRPILAVWGGDPKPDFPGTYGPVEGFWWFPAPEEYLWYVEKQ